MSRLPISIAVALAGTFLAPGAFADDVVLSPGTAYSTGARCANVQPGDFNEDGFLDLASANWNADSVSVLIGDGLGRFAPSVNYPSGDKPWWIAVGDVDGDGHLDLAVACGFSDAVAVHYGRGDGTFDPVSLHPTGLYPRACTMADLNNDGEMDLITANINGFDLSVLLGLGSRAFDVPISIAGGRKPGAVMVDDLDGDGYLDLFAGMRADDEIWIWRNSTFGWVESPIILPTGNGPYCVMPADLDGDGDKDIVCSNLVSNSFSVFKASAPLVFDPPTHYPSGGIQTATSDLADFDGDGHLDLAIAHIDTNNISIHLNDGDGNFTYHVDILNLRRPASNHSADFDRDGAPDIVVAQVSGASVKVFLNRSPLWARQGNVNRGAGSTVPVLSVNGSTGGIRHEVIVLVGEEISIDVDAPPSLSTALHAQYAWLKPPRTGTVTTLFDDLGQMVFPIPSIGIGPAPRSIWNITGDEARFGTPTRVATPAPSRLVRVPSAWRPMVITVQGIIEDGAARTPQGLSVTNSMTIFVQ